MNKEEKESMISGSETGKKDRKMYFMLVLVSLVVVLSIVQTFQIMALKTEAIESGAADTLTSGALDMSSWTEDEKMMYEHHGTIPARFQSSQATSKSSASAMVGGC